MVIVRRTRHTPGAKRPQHIAVGEFLVSRRAKVTPAEVGLPITGYRRTPGLRREEIAMLAGIGVSWYTSIEQGRAQRLSPDVLDAIAHALNLSTAEHRYVRDLARFAEEPAQSAAIPPRCQLQPVVDHWRPHPAYITDRHWNVVAANTPANQILGLRHQDNLLTEFFCNPRTRGRRPRWEQDAADLLARFRGRSTTSVGTPAFTAMIEALRRGSPLFATLWDHHDVSDDADGHELLHDEDLGRLRFSRISLEFTSAALSLTIHLPSAPEDPSGGSQSAQPGPIGTAPPQQQPALGATQQTLTA
ncbi:MULTISPECIES: helix-turn-helix transcriptional regulator [unclassified Crossiella]|uniref:helix-turn-helix domain-containing protein n=1 Tax=unclassified Crossiella TaxID=2620835 RepID=UPI001FFEDCC9|nr:MULTISPECIES: helix-turn-helix transcriptional regulator [unclassified Crossiella]MCK2240024.1 helix-turn-helix transcriptional regulator [Crossiella sp. S99.2]MCK2252732.1 helix-turn-helix transcriptional regulator [Crossiella sp. S99.1]